MGNHGSRPEVVAASVAGLGKDTRLSSTVRREMLYTAVLIEDEGVPLGIARVAAPTSQIHSNVNRIIATISVSALIVAVLSITLGYFLARRTSRSVRSIAVKCSIRVLGFIPFSLAEPLLAHRICEGRILNHMSLAVIDYKFDETMRW